MSYLLIRILTYPCRFFSYRTLHFLGKILGSIAFYVMTDYRKRTLGNLALAKDLNLSSQELFRIAKESFQNLAINCLEYTKFFYEKDLASVVKCENPEIADALYKQGKGIIFFCGHQSNWEVLFLDGTLRMRGIAIGKPIKNRKLYQWIVSIREKHGGRIVSHQSALREGLRALKKGVFVGIVGDQGMPKSGYSFPFFGRSAWTTTAPAFLSYKTDSPIIVATTRRIPGGYRIHYSDPLWPRLQEPIEKEMPRLMDETLRLFEASVRKSPGEWLWQHNRWKQQTPHTLYKRFRKDAICIVLPQEEEALKKILPHLAAFREIFTTDFLFLALPKKYESFANLKADEIFAYEKLDETLLFDYRFKLIFDLADFAPLKKHYLKLSAFEVLRTCDLKKLASPHLVEGEEENLSIILKKALCRPGVIWK